MTATASHATEPPVGALPDSKSRYRFQAVEWLVVGALYGGILLWVIFMSRVWDPMEERLR